MCTPLDSWEIINLDSAAVDNAEKEAREVEQLRMSVTRYEEERKLMLDEISQLKEILKREVTQAETDRTNKSILINDYMLIRQKLEAQLLSAEAQLDDLKMKKSTSEKCSSYLTTSIKKRNNELMRLKG